MKKIILIFILSFFTIGGVFASGWLAGNGKNWISKPDDETRFGNIVTIDGVEAYKDSFTGFYWEAKPSNSSMKHSQAINYCRDKGNAWRFPDIKELQTIITYNKKNKNNAYTNHPNIRNSGYWSNTFYGTNNVDSAFYVYFGSGYVTNMPTTSNFYVICIHD